MRHQPFYFTLMGVGLWLAGALPSHASTIVPTPAMLPVSAMNGVSP